MKIPKIPAALQSDVLDPPAGRLALVVVGESGASRCERFRARLWCSWSARFGAWRKFSSNAARIPARFGGECARGEVPCQLDRAQRAFQRGFVSVALQQGGKVALQ